MMIYNLWKYVASDSIMKIKNAMQPTPQILNVFLNEVKNF